MAHLRVTLRQPHSALEGSKYVVLNDSVEVVDEYGNVIADLSRFVRKVEILDAVSDARLVRLEMFAGDVRAETESPPAVSS